MIKELHEYAEILKNLNPVEWDSFPDIDLYMDQVVTFLEKQLTGYGVGSSEEKTVTANMINNYVKDGHISRPVNKKYGRDQMMYLFLLLQLKAVLPIPVLASGLRGVGACGNLKELYARFVELQAESFRGIASRLETECARVEGNEAEMRLLALRLTSEANVLRVAAEKIFASVDAESKREGET